MQKTLSDAAVCNRLAYKVVARCMQMVYNGLCMGKGFVDMEKAEKSNYVTVRVPRALYDEVEHLLPAFADDPIVKASGRVTVALALRLALIRGISAVRQDFQKRERSGGVADE